MAKRRIKMKRTQLGADPIHVRQYTEGETYLVGKDLADAFIAAGDASRVRKTQEIPAEPGPSENTITAPIETAEEEAPE